MPPRTMASGVSHVSRWWLAHRQPYTQRTAVLLWCATVLPHAVLTLFVHADLGGCSPNDTHTPYPSEYGFDHTGTYGSPVYGHCSGTPPTAKDEVASKAVAEGQQGKDQWWSSDVGDYIRERGIAHMTAATKAHKPFYLHLWWHMSHDTIDPRPEQYNVTFPFKETCLFPATASCQAASGGVGCEPCNWQIFWGVQTYSDMHRFGPVIDAIDALGVRDNTYIIFSADNGAQAERWTSNQGGSGPDGDTSGAFTNAVGTQGPFRGCKASLYDAGHRVPFIVTGPGVPHGRIDHSLISAVDYFPTISALSGNPIPPGTVLRGSDISDIWHGKVNHKTMRAKPLFWRGGGGPPPCWNRSPGLAIRNGDWKLLFNPNNTSGPLRVELYNMSMAGLGLNGAFFEAQNEARHYPQVVEAMVREIMPWHRSTPVPFGAADNTEPDHPRFQPAGCESYPFPGTANAHGPDSNGVASAQAETLLVHSNHAGGDAANAITYAQNLALRRNRDAQDAKPSGSTAADLATPEALAMHHAMQQQPGLPPPPRSTEPTMHRQDTAGKQAQRRRLVELEAEVAALKAELGHLDMSA